VIGRHVRAPQWVDDALPWAAGSRVRVLGERDGQPHVVLLPRQDEGATRTVAKHYTDHSGAAAATAMQLVRTGLARLDAPPLAVPDVGAWHARARVLEQSASRGRPLLPLLRSSTWRQAAVAAAQALACLHALPRTAGRVTTPADHLRELVHPAPAITAALMPASASRILAVEEALLAHTWPETPAAVTIHRDAHARQMTFDGSRVWLLDWDLSASGDAALDVANFAVYVHTHVARRGRAARDTFLEAYGALAPAPMARLPIYTALTYLRLVSKVCRLRRHGWSHRARRFLARAEEALAVEGSWSSRGARLAPRSRRARLTDGTAG
jgi:Phosphotransferase enzyme family